MGCLQALSLNGNPIEEIKGYRLYILGMMYDQYETLKKLDSVIVTMNEFDNVLVWNERLYEKRCNSKTLMKKLKPSEPIKKPPAKEEEENGAKPWISDESKLLWQT